MTSRVCLRCQLPTREPVIVAVGHGASAGGHTAYACPRCAPSFPKQHDPLAEIAALRRARNRGRTT